MVGGRGPTSGWHHPDELANKSCRPHMRVARAHNSDRHCPRTSGKGQVDLVAVLERRQLFDAFKGFSSREEPRWGAVSSGTDN